MAGRPPVPFPALVAGLLLVTGIVLAIRAPWGGETTGVPSGAAPTTPAVTASGEGRSEPEVRPCRIADRRARPRGYDDWAVTLVDTEYGLPRGYEPPDLVSTTEAGFPTDVPIRRLALEDLTALRRAAEEEGVHLDVTFGYRSAALQQILFDEWLTRRPRSQVLATVARPGHSEHQLGTALDFTTAGTGPPDPGWDNTREGAWLAEHAHEYGFVMTYPDGKRTVTCYAAEPWHFRYVGKEMAAEVVASGLTLREHLLCAREGGTSCATLGGA